MQTWWIVLFAVVGVAVVSAENIDVIKLVASDGATADEFGRYVSLSGDGKWAIFGAPAQNQDGPSGSAYIFKLEAGLWKEDAKLKASDDTPNLKFGMTVSINTNGERVVVGAVNTNDNSGQSYVFRREENLWVEEAILVAGGPGDFFGAPAVINGDGSSIVVGAKDTNSETGAVYAFRMNDTGFWNQEGQLIPSGVGAGDWFGFELAMSTDGSRVIVGAPAKPDDTNFLGSAYIFDLNKQGGWDQVAKFQPNDVGTNFGRRVKLTDEGTRVFISAHRNSNGAIHVFSLSGNASEWTQEAILRPGDGQSGDSFGYGFTINGDGNRVLVGAPNSDVAGVDSGSVYLFERTATGIWSEVDKLFPSDGAGGDYFGHTLSMSANGGRAVIDAWAADSKRGAVYVWEFTLPSTSPTVSPTLAPSCYTPWTWKDCDYETQTYQECLEECHKSRGTRWGWTCDSPILKATRQSNCSTGPEVKSPTHFAPKYYWGRRQATFWLTTSQQALVPDDHYIIDDVYTIQPGYIQLEEEGLFKYEYVVTIKIQPTGAVQKHFIDVAFANDDGNGGITIVGPALKETTLLTDDSSTTDNYFTISDSGFFNATGLSTKQRQVFLSIKKEEDKGMLSIKTGRVTLSITKVRD